jgi:hypothetical protein
MIHLLVNKAPLRSLLEGQLSKKKKKGLIPSADPTGTFLLWHTRQRRQASRYKHNFISAWKAKRITIYLVWVLEFQQQRGRGRFCSATSFHSRKRAIACQSRASLHFSISPRTPGHSIYVLPFIAFFVIIITVAVLSPHSHHFVRRGYTYNAPCGVSLHSNRFAACSISFFVFSATYPTSSTRILHHDTGHNRTLHNNIPRYTSSIGVCTQPLFPHSASLFTMNVLRNTVVSIVSLLEPTKRECAVATTSPTSTVSV